MEKHRADSFQLVLPVTYVLLAALALFLNLTSRQGASLSDYLVNIVMFLIIGVVFLKVWFAHFIPVNSMIASLYQVREQLEEEYKQRQGLLWDSYSVRKDIFQNSILDELNEEFKSEYKRKSAISHRGFKTDIEDYINYQVIDNVISKNMLNQVAGAMTGLGILGTFVGLSFGLQSFNTGTAQEITNSIAPLMNGIKVAFHTSIYGMVFSLVFNYVYKRKLDEAYTAVDAFLATFRKCVSPEAQDDNLSILVAYQKYQTEQVRLMQEYQKTQSDQFAYMKENLAGDMAEQMASRLAPKMDDMNQMIDQFARFATRNQMEALSMIVNQFVDEMNRSLSGKLLQLGNVVDQTYAAQRMNAEQMQDIIGRIGNMTGNIDNINSMSGSIVYQLSSYIQKVEQLQDVINRNYTGANRQLDVNTQTLEQLRSYVETLQANEKDGTDGVRQISGTMEQVVYELQELTQAVDALRETMLNLQGRRK